MQNISTEFRRGILFIRLRRRLEYSKLEKEINYFQDEIGIKIIVLNISNLTYFSLKDIKNILEFRKRILKKKNLLIICDTRSNNVFFRKIPRIERETDAFSLI